MKPRPVRQQSPTKPVRSGKREVIGICLIILSLVLLAALASYDQTDWPNSSRSSAIPTHNWIGKAGALAAYGFMTWLGFTSYALTLFMLLAGWITFMHKSLRALIASGFFCGVLGIFLPLLVALTADIGADNTLVEPSFTAGGIFGGFLAQFMVTYLGKMGSYLLSIAAIMVTVVLTTSIRLSTVAELIIAGLGGLYGLIAGIFRGKETPAKQTGEPEPETPEDLEDSDSPFLTPTGDEAFELVETPGRPAFQLPTITIPEERVKEPEPKNAGEENDDYDTLDRQLGTVPEEYVLPGTDLLDPPVQESIGESREELLEQARRIVESLRHFSIDAEVKNITPGPIVTRYEITLAPGIKVGKVVGLSNDLSMALRAKGAIRILAPIPGKAAIGIEVPNKVRSIVYIREIAESDAFLSTDKPLALAVGKSTSGEPIVADLAKMPHLLIAGSTGSGKSVCINTIIASILMKATPRDVRMIMVDPKVVELSIYNPIPHLLTPVIIDPKRAASSLKWAVREMESRYRRLATLGVRDVEQYNRRVDQILENPSTSSGRTDKRHQVDGDSAESIAGAKSPQTVLPERLPLIVIIIDEYADLMVLAAKEIEESIARLAQMARAVGMHLILATQRPSADVITGLIKANFPSRIAFKVMQASNSRIILDEGGADKLLGMGDMLFMQAGKPEPLRLHGAYITNEECSRIVSFIKEHSSVPAERISESEFEEVESSDENSLGLRDPNDRDALFFEAARLVVRHNQGSVSLLQRRLKVGYARAARLIDQLELAGVVSPYDGSKAREVMVDDQYIDALEEGNL